MPTVLHVTTDRYPVPAPATEQSTHTCNKMRFLACMCILTVCRETTWELCRKGYTVVLACRSAHAAHKERQKIADAATGGCPVVIGPLDLGSVDSIKAFITAFQRSHPRLDVLVNNAGCNFVSDWSTDKGVPGIVQACLKFVLHTP